MLIGRFSCLPDCYYGDKKYFCYDIDAEECKTDTVASTCCQKCGFFLEKGCDGNASDKCSNTYSECYNRSFEKACCDTCYQVYDAYLVRDTDCMYGNRGRNCNYLSSRECYYEDKYQECCYYCYNDARNNEMPSKV
ncbi:hypothetical protein CHS0354_000398 [Potamilus streckersoni]|uniref:Uncharacterized protein n=1 Tax=Potamilus streckersoni TaxID=2493646 RepID=A0AAE0SMD9_9BIVA|nr:hypothetical protein CHS0354_000398 [Potamilus streckersoni]